MSGMRKAYAKKDVWRLCALAYVLALTGGCGKDARLTITEEKVPNPPVHQIQSDATIESAYTREHKRLAKLPEKPVDSVVSPTKAPAAYVEASTSKDAGASFIYRNVGEEFFTQIFDQRSQFDCTLIKAKGHLPLYRIHFVQKSTRAEKTDASMTLQLFGVKNDEMVVRGAGKKTVAEKTDKILVGHDVIEVNAGEDARNDLLQPSAFRNGRFVHGPLVTDSRCRVRLTTTTRGAGEAKLLTGAFECDDLGNRAGELLSVDGSFSCPLSESENLHHLNLKAEAGKK